MITGLFVGVCIGLGVGIIIAAIVHRAAHKAIAKTLAEFAAVDQDARSLVNRCWRHLADATRKELEKLLPR